ncbi:GNAT family N-acetyltransferase [Streptomyces sp. NBC_01335]|uniref:GNAT family N-acetyltransferase n=1 Tax=Streptomyces sp. NBC_01335 TaxID=2903828 RepID=UPI002E10CC57|nr:GNAT family N-acetyltransferase [Streptomyces sp. NBC_01335]
MDTDVQSFAVVNLQRRPVVVETGGFVAGFDPATSSPYINYATPLPGARPTPDDVRALVGAFRGRGLLPRLEFAPDAAPAVEPALRAAGFTVEEVHPYLVCTPATLIPRSSTVHTRGPNGGPALRVETPVSEEEFAAVDAALSESFDGAFAPTAHGTARLRRTQESGGGVRFVRAPDGSCAGGASCSAPAVGTAELAGVGTRPAFRGRGIAGAVTAALTGAMFDRGAESVWLEFSGEGSRRVYERLGYRSQGTRLYMRLEA